MHYGGKPKNSKTYQVEFFVRDDGQSTPILGNSAMQELDLVTVQHQNVMAVNTETHRCSQHGLSKVEVLEGYADVFYGIGKPKG